MGSLRGASLERWALRHGFCAFSGGFHCCCVDQAFRYTRSLADLIERSRAFSTLETNAITRLMISGHSPAVVTSSKHAKTASVLQASAVSRHSLDFAHLCRQLYA